MTNKNVTVTGDGFAAGEGATYNVTGSQTEVGGTANNNVFTYTLNEGTTATDYSITTVAGTLTVTKSTKAVTITSADGNKMYDGEQLTAPTYTVKYGDTVVTANEDGTFTLPTGDTLTITDTSNVVHVADTAANNNTFTYELENADQYETVTPTYGTLEISKREVTLISADDRKVYDATALTNDEVTVSGDGFAEGEGATYDVTGTQTLAGSSANTFTYTLDEGTLADNYEITTVEGTLTVTDGEQPDDEEEVPDELVVVKDDNTEKAYKVGETVTWTITVTNIYDEEKTLTVNEAEGMTLVGEVPATLTAGQTVELKAQHIVTEADATNGTITNTVTVKIGDLEKKGEDTAEVTPRYRLTVNYWIGTTPAADSFTNVYDSGDTYTVTSPIILGYTADKDRVTGTITADTTLDVYYTVNTYNLIITYTYLDGTEAAPPVTIPVEYNTNYSVPVPVIAGYTPNSIPSNGLMPARDVTYTIIYTRNPAQRTDPTPEPTPEPETVPVDHVPYEVLGDYDTPLGIPNLSISAGEVFE